MKPLQFGTDGWRGVIADDFTSHCVVVVCEAIGDDVHEEGTAAQGLVIGYDNRFASENVAALAATMLTWQGIQVRLSPTSVPTPVVSITIQHHLGSGSIPNRCCAFMRNLLIPAKSARLLENGRDLVTAGGIPRAE